MDNRRKSRANTCFATCSSAYYHMKRDMGIVLGMER